MTRTMRFYRQVIEAAGWPERVILNAEDFWTLLEIVAPMDRLLRYDDEYKTFRFRFIISEIFLAGSFDRPEVVDLSGGLPE